MTNYGIKPIAAFSMAEYEQITRGTTAEFKRGKDKKKRKRRGLGFYAGVGAAGTAGIGALGAAARYGGAAASTALAQRRLYNGAPGTNAKSNKIDGWKNMKMDVNTARNAASGGARGQLKRDVDSAKQLGSKIKNYDYKGIPGKLGNKAKAAGQGAMNIGKGLTSAAASRPLRSAGLALGGAAALGGVAYGAKKLLDRNKKKK